ncbi:MAG TPA: Ni/Fe hydrogenase subunit alpha [Gaiella sp.]|jgi:coenzyme F420-reducing hydrogenase alpha subunit|nr:Ni/Fe hydrogenase subunit alpha [Gaiella sp.]
MPERRTIRTDYLPRVEGEGAMSVRLANGTVEHVELRIFEPPRFFEAMLRGRSFLEAPDITARICGICPVAYQMSALNAMEAICGVEIPEPLQMLRRLLYCGEWIESHTLHVYMLHAPDFLGYDGAVELARDAPAIVERGLRLKKTGNEVMTLVGGREIHPINVRVGGFYKTPTKRELRALVDPLEHAREAALETVRWTAGFEFPEYDVENELVALSRPGTYAIEDGRVASDRGLDIPIAEYEEHFVEEHVERSNALHSRRRSGETYLCGPMARYPLNADRLSPLAAEAAREAGLEPSSRNPFRSIVVRSVEIVYACDEALRLIEAYEEPDAPAVPVEPSAGVGHGATEAPRGLLYHRYQIDGDGTILDAKIVPPTSQNQLAIEDDLRDVVGRYADRADEELRALCEQTIRNYDPCISCATHFLSLEVERR